MCRACGALAIPDALPLVGFTLYQQLVLLEIVASAFVATSSSNALTVTVGAL